MDENRIDLMNYFVLIQLQGYISLVLLGVIQIFKY